MHTLREIMRVAKDGATVEIWTPYGKSNDAFLLGHRNFYTETHWKHICFEYDCESSVAVCHGCLGGAAIPRMLGMFWPYPRRTASEHPTDGAIDI